uniref:Small rubber particle protein n=1 Tax=Hevea brasiliensis TaxID=3981 RepID=W0JFK7_HEVBR|nr:small rubber particle protein [Hevea brasiliensis]
MAEEVEEERLKYLDFVRAAGVYAVDSFSTLYLYAKDISGPLKPGVDTIENVVKTVVTPVYYIPLEAVKFVDKTVDVSVTSLDGVVPPVIKQVSAQTYSVAQDAPRIVLDVASSVFNTGVQEGAKALYANLEPKAEQYAVITWRALNKLPLVPQVANVVVPTAVYFSEKYNDVVRGTVEQGYRVSSYLPLLPTEKITKVFGDEAS